MGHEAYASSTAKPEAPNRDRPEGGGPLPVNVSLSSQDCFAR